MFFDWIYGLHPQKLTWNLEMMVSNRNLLFQGSIFRFHVCFDWVYGLSLAFREEKRGDFLKFCPGLDDGVLCGSSEFRRDKRCVFVEEFLST